MIYTVRYIFAILFVFLTGSTCLRYIDRHAAIGSRLERAALAWALGLVAICFFQLYLIALRIPLGRPSLLMLIIPVVLLNLYVPLRRRIAQRSDRPLMPDIRAWFVARRRCCIDASVVRIIAVSFIVLLCVLMIAACVFLPLYTWDSRAIWSFKAKVIFSQGTVLNSDFLDISRFHPHQSYPLLVPLAQNFFYLMLGTADEYLVKILFALMYVSMLALMYSFFNTSCGISKTVSAALTAACASVPCFFVIYNGSVPSAYADFPLAFFYGLTFIYLVRFMRSGRLTALGIATCCAAATLFTKNEGIVLFILASLVLAAETVAAGSWKERKGLIAVSVFIGTAILIVVPWFLLRSALPRGDENNPLSILNAAVLARGMSRLPLVLGLTFREMFRNIVSWGVFWYVSVAALLVCIGQRVRGQEGRLRLYTLLVPLVYWFAVITPLYTFFTNPATPIELEFEGTSFERLRLHALPVLMLFIGMTIGTFLDPGRADETKRHETV